MIKVTKKEWLKQAKDIKLNKNELRKLLIYLCKNENGDLDLSGLNFSEFDGNIDISGMEVKRNLTQSYHKVGGNLYQGHQEVKGNLIEGNNKKLI